MSAQRTTDWVSAWRGERAEDHRRGERVEDHVVGAHRILTASEDTHSQRGYAPPGYTQPARIRTASEDTHSQRGYARIAMIRADSEGRR
jgi:hypothetical protein